MSNENVIPVKYTNVYKRNLEAKLQTVINAGGAGSSKTFSLCQFFIFERLFKLHDYNLLILRKVRHACKLSVYEMMIALLNQYKLYTEKDHNKSDLIYKIPKLNNKVRFAGLEDKEDIKSTEWHDIWCEEGNQFHKPDYTFLKTRLYRGSDLNGTKPRIWFSFNPEDCWIFDLEGKENVEFIYSNYKDNPFCNEEYIKTLEGLKDEDEVAYKIFALGQRAKATGVIYKSYIMESQYPDSFDDEIYGLDFGFNNPSALLKIQYKDNERYLAELIYDTHLTNSQLIEKMKDIIPEEKRGLPFYCDSAEPQRIEEISTAGFNCLPADKSKNSVKDGIDFCRRQKYHTLSTNINLNKEVSIYRYRQDKDGNSLEEPVKFKDHLMDAKRYADYTHNKRGVLRIL